MPELPEVEVAARNLRRWATGRRVRAVRADPRAARIFRPAAPRALAVLAGARFGSVQRRGKNLLVTLMKAKGGAVGVWSHLGMTGKWLHRRGRDAAPRFARVRIDLDDGASLHYADLRMFGRFRLVPDARFDALPDIAALGPDPLNDGIDTAWLAARLARTRLPIKVAILDQTLLPGIGNIQASEGLFRAGIDPRRAARSLSRAEIARLGVGLLESIRYTLKTFKQSGADGADADIDYVEERKIPNPFLVYGRAGERCPRRVRGKRGKRGRRGKKGGDGGKIVRIVQAQRATFFCPRCQH
jgi:formamidopyrimidine-DNA glycosylase